VPPGTERAAAEGLTTVPGAQPAPSAPATSATTQPAAPQQPAAPPQPPARQIAAHILPLRQGADGVHRMTIHLHPAELGAVSVTAEIRGGAVMLQIYGAADAAHDALRSALPQLREALERDGFTSCSLDLRRDAPGDQRQASGSGGDPDSRSRSGEDESRDGAPRGAGRAGAADGLDGASAPGGPRTDRLLDLRL
jgi:flagellar hook-length control protein FliK